MKKQFILLAATAGLSMSSVAMADLSSDGFVISLLANELQPTINSDRASVAASKAEVEKWKAYLEIGKQDLAPGDTTSMPEIKAELQARIQNYNADVAIARVSLKDAISSLRNLMNTSDFYTVWSNGSVECIPGDAVCGSALPTGYTAVTKAYTSPKDKIKNDQLAIKDVNTEIAADKKAKDATELANDKARLDALKVQLASDKAQFKNDKAYVDAKIKELKETYKTIMAK